METPGCLFTYLVSTPHREFAPCEAPTPQELPPFTRQSCAAYCTNAAETPPSPAKLLRACTYPNLFISQRYDVQEARGSDIHVDTHQHDGVEAEEQEG